MKFPDKIQTLRKKNSTRKLVIFGFFVGGFFGLLAGLGAAFLSLGSKHPVSVDVILSLMIAIGAIAGAIGAYVGRYLILVPAFTGGLAATLSTLLMAYSGVTAVREGLYFFIVFFPACGLAVGICTGVAMRVLAVSSEQTSPGTKTGWLTDATTGWLRIGIRFILPGVILLVFSARMGDAYLIIISCVVIILGFLFGLILLRH